jgi:2-C-methyl-D-erythritol 4-phosphate cytidylyltransferase
MNREKYVIITAGGAGSRMGADIPKQILEIGGKPILSYTFNLFLNLPFKVNIILVAHPDIRKFWLDYCDKERINLRYVLAKGGMTRFHSVKEGLRFVPDGAIVAVHDGVRPFISREKIISMFEMAQEHPAVIPVLPLVDSIREVRPDGTSLIADRSKYRLVQTPQIFHSEVLKQAYQTPFSPEFTDDASVVEKLGIPLTFAEGERFNIKITTKEDLVLSELLLKTIW